MLIGHPHSPQTFISVLKHLPVPKRGPKRLMQFAEEISFRLTQPDHSRPIQKLLHNQTSSTFCRRHQPYGCPEDLSGRTRRQILLGRCSSVSPVKQKQVSFKHITKSQVKTFCTIYFPSTAPHSYKMCMLFQHAIQVVGLAHISSSFLTQQL